MLNPTYSTSSRLLKWLSIIGFALIVAATIVNFVYPGTEQTMGDLFRLFYIHIGTFYGGFFAFFAAVVAGVAYIRTQNPKWDHLGIAGIEIGLGLSTITIVTGSIWAKRLWGQWWVWDPRLTSVAIMWLTYAAYFMLRAGFEDHLKRRRFAAVYSILAFSSVLFTIVIIRVRTDVMHSAVIGPSFFSSSNDSLITPRIAQTTLFNVLAYIVFAIALMWHRIRIQVRSETVLIRKIRLLEQL